MGSDEKGSAAAGARARAAAHRSFRKFARFLSLSQAHEEPKEDHVRRTLIGGLLGGIVMIAWFVVADAALGLKRSVDMKTLPNERIVYAFLAENIVEPGRYVCNPELLPEQRFPGDAPIFAVDFSGLDHDDAGQEMFLGLAVALLACIAGAWLLANSSRRILSRYGSRVLFLAMIGLVVAVLSMAARFGISAYSFGDALALAGHDFAAWVVAGLAVARVVRASGE